MNRFYLLITIVLLCIGCGSDKNSRELVDEDRLGIIDADVRSEETNLKEKARYIDATAGDAQRIERSFENAPPLIPHTTEGFLPIKSANNICLTCHLPDKIEETGAIAVPESHFSNMRPNPELTDGVYIIPETLTNEYIGKLNNQYFNCNQCHVPQTQVSVDIENLFTPEFREEFGINKSDLNSKVEEGI